MTTRVDRPSHVTCEHCGTVMQAQGFLISEAYIEDLVCPKCDKVTFVRRVPPHKTDWAAARRALREMFIVIIVVIALIWAFGISPWFHLGG